MNILEKEIKRIQSELKTRDYIDDGYRIWLRQLVKIANQEQDGFWCSECGDKFKSPKLRSKHVDDKHAENNIKWS